MASGPVTQHALCMNPAIPCVGCGLEVEAWEYFRRGDVRVGYHCSCGAVVIDGLYEGHSPNF